MSGAQQSGSEVHGRQPPLAPLLAALGTLAGAAAVILAIAAATATTQVLLVGPDPTVLHAGSQSGYLFPHSRSIGPDFTGLWIAGAVVTLGLAVLGGGIVAAARTRRSSGAPRTHRGRRSSVSLLLAAGVVLSIAGLLGGLIARAAADRASFIASSARRLVSDPANPLALSFDPASAHYTPPDYTGFWLGIVVVGLGIALLVAAIVRSHGADDGNRTRAISLGS